MKPFTEEDLKHIVEESAKSGVPLEKSAYGASYAEALRELGAMKEHFALNATQMYSIDMALRLIHLDARHDSDGLHLKLENALMSAPPEIRREVLQDYCLRCFKFESACKCHEGRKQSE